MRGVAGIGRLEWARMSERGGMEGVKRKQVWGFREMKGSGKDKEGEEERKEEKALRAIRQKEPEIWAAAMETCHVSRGGLNRTARGQRAAGLVAAELTYIDLTENNVYYAANHNQGVEHIPGIPKIALSEGQRVVGKWDQNKRQILILH